MHAICHLLIMVQSQGYSVAIMDCHSHTLKHGIFATVEFCGFFFNFDLFTGGNFCRFLTHGK